MRLRLGNGRKADGPHGGDEVVTPTGDLTGTTGDIFLTGSHNSTLMSFDRSNPPRCWLSNRIGLLIVYEPNAIKYSRGTMAGQQRSNSLTI